MNPNAAAQGIGLESGGCLLGVLAALGEVNCDY